LGCAPRRVVFYCCAILLGRGESRKRDSLFYHHMVVPSHKSAVFIDESVRLQLEEKVLT